MTILTASKTIPATWYKNPVRTKSISPNDAMTTPMTMAETLRSFLKSTDSTRRAHVARRTATGVVALSSISQCVNISSCSAETYLKHLNERNAQIQVCQISADQTQAEEQSNGHNCSQVHLSSHRDFLSAIKKGCCAGQDLCHHGCKDKMPCCQENGIIWISSAKNSGVFVFWRRTEFQG